MSLNQLKIGILFSLTGSMAVTETGQYRSAILAIKQINEMGGIQGVPIQAVVEDISSDPLIARKKAIQLIEKDRVHVLVGTYTSACRKALLPVLKKYDILLLYPTLYEGNEQNPWVFYCGALPNQQLRFFVPWIISHLGKSYYLIGSDYIFPKETNKHMHKLLNIEGGRIVGESYTPLGSKAFEHILRDIERCKPDVIFSTLVGDSAVSFYQQFHQYGFTLPICSPITAETEIAAMGPKYAENHYSSFPYFKTIPTAANRSFIQAYQELYGSHVISSVMENTYNSLFLLKNALQIVSRVDTPSLRRALSKAEFDAPQGHIRFDEKTQHLWQHSRIGRVNGQGDFEILWESQSPIAPIPFMFGPGKDPLPNVQSAEGTNLIFDLAQLKKEQIQERLNKWKKYLDFFTPLSSLYPFPFFLVDADGILLYILNSNTNSLEKKLAIHLGSNWSVETMGNNGIGLAIEKKQTTLVTGIQHENSLLQDFTTVGIPMVDRQHCLGAIGIIAPIEKTDQLQYNLTMFEMLIRSFVLFLNEKKRRILFERLLKKDSGKNTEGFFILHNKEIIFSNEFAHYLLKSKSLEIDAIINELTGIADNNMGKFIRKKVGQNLFEIRLEHEEDYHFIFIKTINTDAKSPSPLGKQITFQHIIGNEKSFLRTLQIAKIAAQTEANVFLVGESGTGKELFANAIHNESIRKDKPFIAINCGAIPKDLVLAEIFGYVEGAFPGAKKEGHAGIFELANGGTIFFDEIGEMPLEFQMALLRVIEEKAITRIGDHTPIPVDVRIIAATNKNIKEEIAYNGSFRSDLYYRLNVFKIELPPLRKRKQDIPELANYFLDELNRKNNTEKQFSSSAMERFMQHFWPGNIRELRNTVERSYYLSHLQPVIDDVHLESFLPPATNQPPRSSLGKTIIDPALSERDLIIQSLKENDHNISKVSRKLGISRTTLYKKMKQYQIKR